MNSIEQKAINTYQNNLNYFKNKYPNLYTKLITLETAISENLYEENYSLEYKDNSYFDIQETSSNNFLYNENSYEYTKKLIKTLDLKRTGSVFEGQQRFDIKDEEVEEIEKFENFHSSLWATAKIINYNAQVAPKFDSEMQKLYKFIFLSTGLGLHIKEIIEKYKIKVVFIHEKNLELFRLSLFVTDYKETLKNTIPYFSIMQDYTDMQSTFVNFLNEAYNHNLYIKFLPFAQDSQEDLKTLQSITISQNHILYPYQAFMARSFSAIEKISNNKYFLNMSKTYNNTTLSKNPILVLASGPSLQNNITWIKENQDKFLIIAVLSSCKYLFLHNITPDIVVHIDPEEAPSLAIIEDVDMNKFNETTLIFGSSVHKHVVDKFKRDDIIFIEEGTTFKVGYGFYTNSSIGEYATTLPLTLGSNDVYLIGLDLALDPNTMKDHIDTHISTQIINHDENEISIKYSDSICYVKGNFLDSVPSKPNFRFSIMQFYKSLQMYKKSHQNIYNLSNGAYLEGTIPLHIEDVQSKSFKIINKNDINKKVIEFLKQYSSSKFREEDKQHILSQTKIAKEIIVKCQNLKKLKSKKPENYLANKLLPFVQDICEMNETNKSDIGQIFFEYFKITLSFAFDTFNTKNLKNSKKHVENIDNIILEEVEKIASTYVNEITKYINK